MSKHVLLDADVTNLIVKDLVGLNAVDQYLSQAPEWSTKRIFSNVLYSAIDAKQFPPIVIEVVDVANSNFLHQVVQYCEEVNLRYGAVPLVLIFVVERVQDDITSNTTRHYKHPFLLKLPSFPWAKDCFVVSKSSIQDHLTNMPLHPLVALTIFFTTQKPDFLDHDPTIQKLYNILQKTSENATLNREEIAYDISRICNDFESRLDESIRLLSRLKNTESKKRAIDCLNGGIATLVSYKRKYIPNPSRELSPLTSSSSRSSVSLVTSPSLSENWSFVERFIEGYDKKKMDWKACYFEGRLQGLFTNYTTHISLKNSYQRWKNQHGPPCRSRRRTN
ncbi:hypothetical protein EDC96DRAFT_510047 [Choanephora cucurbitarum]|nr:hypothetical protein EDC96DRAFT_510047 [Choanephora cucurbitarum]